MNRSVELENPFANPEQALNTNDVDFIGDVLGPEAKSLFSSLETRETTTLGSKESMGEFAMTDQELQELESSLPEDFWGKIDGLVKGWLEADEKKVTDEWFKKRELWKEFKLTLKQMQDFCDRILQFARHADDIPPAQRGYLFSHLLNYSISVLPTKEQKKIQLRIGENDKMDGLGWRWLNGDLEITAPVGNYFAFEMLGGYIKCIEAGDNAGTLMQGGLLEIGKAQNMCGAKMLGGEIVVNEASDDLGFQMRGGEIWADIAGDRVGNDMYADAKVQIWEKAKSYSPNGSGVIIGPDSFKIRESRF